MMCLLQSGREKYRMYEVIVYWKQGNSSAYEVSDASIIGANNNILKIVSEKEVVYIPIENIEYWSVGYENEEECKHEHIIRWEEDWCKCEDCNETIWEWYCPDSPDHFCHYDNGDMDQCGYCGEPEERK